MTSEWQNMARVSGHRQMANLLVFSPQRTRSEYLCTDCVLFHGQHSQWGAYVLWYATFQMTGCDFHVRHTLCRIRFVLCSTL